MRDELKGFVWLARQPQNRRLIEIAAYFVLANVVVYGGSWLGWIPLP